MRRMDDSTYGIVARSHCLGSQRWHDSSTISGPEHNRGDFGSWVLLTDLPSGQMTGENSVDRSAHRVVVDSLNSAWRGHLIEAGKPAGPRAACVSCVGSRIRPRIGAQSAADRLAGRSRLFLKTTKRKAEPSVSQFQIGLAGFEPTTF